jgi:radical SAM protein with 4Fe4S-binding SPASM domain
MMSERVFKKAVREYVSSGGGSVSVTPTVGDPLIHPQFVEWVRYLRSIPQIDQIAVTTNGILLNKHGVDEILDSGLSAINISTAGFDEEMYRRIYRSDKYRQFRDGVYKLYEANAGRTEPVPIFLCFRPDRPAKAILSDPDLKPLLKYQPNIQICETFSRSGGLISILPSGMRLAPIATSPKRITCGWMYGALMVLSNGNVQVCGCESAVNAEALIVGNIEEESLLSIWHGARLRELRESFRRGSLNANCSKCDDYYSPVNFSSKVSRQQAAKSRRRQRGEIVRTANRIEHPFQLD